MPPHRRFTLHDPSPCAVCGAYQGDALTTDCPGARVSPERQKEIYETGIDYTDARGWHQGVTVKLRSPRWCPTFNTRLAFVTAPGEGGAKHSDSARAPSTADWVAAERTMALRHTLADKAISWVLADRICDDHSAMLGRVENEVDEWLHKGRAPDEGYQGLLEKLSHVRTGFQLANQRADSCDAEFRKAARELVTALEQKVP